MTVESYFKPLPRCFDEASTKPPYRDSLWLRNFVYHPQRATNSGGRSCNVMLAKPGPRKRSPPLAQSKVTVSPFRVRCVDRGKSISQIFYSGIHHDLLVAVRISLPKVDEIQTLAACESRGRLTCMRRRLCLAKLISGHV